MTTGAIVGIGVLVAARVITLRARDGSGTPPASPVRADASDSIEGLIRGGRKIEAIKLYREQHGVGLREAKEAVEAVTSGSAVD